MNLSGSMTNKPTIGIIGGVGPSAGLDLADKVFMHTKATGDQDHIDMILISCPSIIPDRTAYLLEGGADPAPGLQKCMELLSFCGVTAFGIACNTAHSPRILGHINFPAGVNFINMIEVTCKAISERFGKAKIGILSTLGTLKTGIYNAYFDRYPDLELVTLDDSEEAYVHDAIYNPKYGIKAKSKVSHKSLVTVTRAIRSIKEKGCAAAILACTELPLVFPNTGDFDGIELIDPTEILAIELIKATEPEKLI